MATKFYQLRADKVINTFQIEKNVDCVDLKNWLDASIVLSDFENQLLDFALQKYATLGDGWNEEELKMHFISFVLATADINIPKICKTFFERPLSGIIDDYELNIVCDCMVASPRLAGDPDKPYFFLQEFKQAQRFGRTDPQGQVLVAMLLAQAMNDNNKPLYGCYVIERQWFFTTLIGRSYCVSKAYDATKKDDLIEIVAVLRNLKSLIVNNL
jgi:hypothetical protein